MMGAWEAQQRAQKEQERKANQEAAAALQGYRRSGLSEEERKLAALREEERLQKQSATEQLRGYRGQLSEDEVRLAAQRQEELRKKQALEEQLRNNGVVSAHDPAAIHDSILKMASSGAVSELAAGYASPSAPPRPASSLAGPTSANESSARPDGSSAATTISNDATEGVAGSNNDAAAAFRVSPTATTGAAATTTEPVSYPMVPAPEAPLPTPPAAIKSQALFMFGILTTADVDTASPEERSRLVSRYLSRADEIARSVVHASPSYRSILPSLAYPVASIIQKDPSRTDAHRTTVTVTISFSAPDQATARGFKSKIIERVRAAISNGNFTRH